MDANEEQLKQCKPQPNITFKTGCAEKIDLPSSSLDLVTVATALHWCVHVAFCRTLTYSSAGHGPAFRFLVQEGQVLLHGRCTLQL